jgi:antitoxin component of MazEF toxin-antitoxin module
VIFESEESILICLVRKMGTFTEIPFYNGIPDQQVEQEADDKPEGE